VSYDLAFWRQEEDFDGRPEDIYRQLLEGHAVDGLVAIGVATVLAAARERFPAMTQIDPASTWLLWESADAQAVMELAWSDRHVHAVCRSMTEDDMNELIDICLDAGCALYDPQLGERFSQPQAPTSP
jgi:hypothetical protein